MSDGKEEIRYFDGPTWQQILYDDRPATLGGRVAYFLRGILEWLIALLRCLLCLLSRRRCAGSFASVTCPQYITTDGACFSYHLKHTGQQEMSTHPDALTYALKDMECCRNCTVIGTSSAGEPSAQKQIKNGKEVGQHAGEPPQL